MSYIKQEDFELDNRFKLISKGSPAGSFIELKDGSLLNISSINGGTVRISKDDGNTWSHYSTMYEGPGPGRLTRDIETGIALKTREGIIIWIYRDFESMSRLEWDNVANEAIGKPRLDVWSIRSLDGGKTWVDRQMIFKGYCGALINIIQTVSGHIVVPVQCLLPEPSRHAQFTCISSDDGKTWKKSNIIDLGGNGHHDGGFESVLVEISDHRLYMLIRTGWDRFFEAYSWDNGYSWRQVGPGNICATSSPGFITRLKSGRLVLAWNPLPPGEKPRSLSNLRPEGRVFGSDYGSRAHSEYPANFSRRELAIAFSEDDGETWSQPTIFAKGEGIAYLQIWERRPGEMWISFQKSVKGKSNEICLIAVRENDLV